MDIEVCRRNRILRIASLLDPHTAIFLSLHQSFNPLIVPLHPFKSNHIYIRITHQTLQQHMYTMLLMHQVRLCRFLISVIIFPIHALPQPIQTMYLMEHIVRSYVLSGIASSIWLEVYGLAEAAS